MPTVIAVIIEISICVCVLWVISFLSTLFHELGHAAGYMFSTGGRRWHIRVGSGKKLLETKFLTVKLLILDGYFDPAEDRIDTKAKLISTLLGGPAVSLILVAALLILRSAGVSFESEILASGTIEFFLNYALFYNAFILIMSVIPAHYFSGEIRGLETDGLKILNALRDRDNR
ncbi:MAG: hypothetical protein IKX27_05285 [Oscillospiraceae bacterium]|nr:hypothetical protein [Oscillospiraceae bacterium]